jgi:hypothetical protein
MADINIRGINLTTGQSQPAADNDILTTNENMALREAYVGPARGMPGTSPPGALGFTGTQGVTGALGFSGITGLQGTTGSIGFRGETGILGETGLHGATGPRGRTGIQAVTGLRGVTGSQGYANYYFVFGSTGLASTAEIIGLASTGGSFTVTLPSATGMQRSKTFILQDQAGVCGTNPVRVISQFYGGGPGNLYGSINGTTGITINSPYMAVEIYSNGNRYLARSSKQGATGLQGITGAQGATGVA